MCGFVSTPGEIEGLKSQVEKSQVGDAFCRSYNQYMMYSLAKTLADVRVVLSSQSMLLQDIFR